MLVFNGAPINLLDNQNLQPIAYAKDITNPKLRLEILKTLQQQKTTLKQWLQYETQLKKQNKSWVHMIIYFAAHLFFYGILVLFQFPLYQNEVIIYFIIGILVLQNIFYLICAFKDAGKIKPSESIKFLELLQLIDPLQLCPTCKIVKTPRSKHCNICDCCVERFDHHCPWINNCVGVKNHNYFLIFLTLLTTQIASIFSLTCYTYYHYIRFQHFQANNWMNDLTPLYQLLPTFILLYPAIAHITSLLLVTFMFLALLAIGFQLWLLHIMIYFTNKTTKERSGRPKSRRVDSTVNPGSFSATTSMLAEMIVE